MDIVTYTLLKKQIGKLPLNSQSIFSYRGEMGSYEALINYVSNPTFGDIYLISDENRNYYYNGESWQSVDTMIPSDIKPDNKSIIKSDEGLSLIGFLEAKEGTVLTKGVDGSVSWQEISKMGGQVNFMNIVQTMGDSIILDSGNSEFD